MLNLDYPLLIEKAQQAKSFSYAPYSNFHVGAALLADNGAIYTGCNIENAAYTPTNCAERTAFFKAVSEGVHSFSAIAVINDTDDYCSPCGVCRQVMREFCDPKTFQVILARNTNDYLIMTLEELLPKSFGKEDL